MRDSHQNVLDDDRVGRLLIKLSIPAFFGMFVMTLYNVVDTIFIGRYVGPLGIAGLSIVFPLQMLSMGVGAMFGMGGASLISRLLGANNISRAEHALGNSLTPVLLLSTIIMVAGLANPDFWLRLMGASETILPYARDYMTIILIGMFFQTAGMSISSLIRAEGNAIVPMIGMIMGAVLNIILDAIFIIPLDMGIKGAALATVIAQVISVGYFLRYYLSGKSYLKIHPRNLILKLDILKDILAIGIASFARTIATSLTAVFVNRLLISYGGDLAISAFGIVNRIMMFAMMPAMIFAQGMQPILGYNYGAKRFDRALKIIKITAIISTITSSIVFLVLYFSPEPFMRIFTTDTELVTLGSYAAKRVFLVLYLLGFTMVASLVFQSLGQAAKSFITSIGRSFVFLVPFIFVLPQFMGLEGIFLAYPIADVLAFLLALILVIPTIKALRKAEKQGNDGLPTPERSDNLKPRNFEDWTEVTPDAD
ncbi:MATE family efflux transporter [Chloroflexota bacterium]